MTVQVLAGDCVKVMQSLADASVDAVVTDPPYGLEFMGREWDGANGFRRSLNIADAGRESVFGRSSRTSPEYRAGTLFQEWCEAWAVECLRVLKPGGYLLAFGGTRTYHRLACGIEDAGFEIRDSLHWIYGTGFPKGKACLKPAHEPILLARKPGIRSEPFPGLDSCRVEGIKGIPASPRRAPQGVTFGELGNDSGEGTGWDPEIGRWPPNILLGGEAAAELDRQSGGSVSRIGKPRKSATAGDGWGDSGGASRYFPVFKYNPKAGNAERPHVDGVPAHPTVKPAALMRWLTRLVTPSGGIVLDPFAGTGTTGEACLDEGFRCILIEQDEGYLKLIGERLSRREPTLFDGVM